MLRRKINQERRRESVSGDGDGGPAIFRAAREGRAENLTLEQDLKEVMEEVR